MTEQEMRDARVHRLETPQELSNYIDSLVKQEHDYGTCVYAMSMAATATFNYVAHRLGATGFQASCADLDILRRTRNIDGPFALFKGRDALYPQYDLQARLDELLLSWRGWLAKEAAKLLAEIENAHPDVIAHWRKLADYVEEGVE